MTANKQTKLDTAQWEIAWYVCYNFSLDAQNNNVTSQLC